MACGTLYTYPGNFRAFKALIAAEYSGAKIKLSADFKFGETNKADDYLKKFYLGKVPAFEDSNGLHLFEANAIAYHVSNKALRGGSENDVALILQWMNFADDEILPAASTWVFPCLGIMQYNKQSTEKAKEDVKVVLDVLNRHLETRTYLVGERITLADIAVCCNLLQLYQWVLEPEFRKPYQNTNRWLTTLINQPHFRAVIGDVKLCEKMAQFDAKKYQELQQSAGSTSGGGHDKKQEKKEKKEKHEKEEKKPQKEKPVEAPAPAADEEEEDEFADKPTKDPFAALPKGTFVMDDWKKCYSNNDTKKVALPYFESNFDAENYSLWYCEYLFPKELQKIFMSSNLVGGMFQRLDKMRKHAFGSMIIFGEDNNSTISGVWLWRGQELAFNLHDDLKIDFGSYEWKKLNWTDPHTHKLVEEYFSWEGAFDGKKFNQGKIFK